MNYENILVDKNDRIATVTINRPTKLNALNKATIKELHEVFADLQSDEEVRAIVVIGSGEDADESDDEPHHGCSAADDEDRQSDPVTGGGDPLGTGR